MRMHQWICGAIAAGGLIAATSAVALPLTIGDQVQVGNQSGGPFTPSPDNGLFAGVTFSLNGGGGTSASVGLASRNTGGSTRGAGRTSIEESSCRCFARSRKTPP
mgnify:CR=1 FL=1